MAVAGVIPVELSIEALTQTKVYSVVKSDVNGKYVDDQKSSRAGLWNRYDMLAEVLEGEQIIGKKEANNSISGSPSYRLPRPPLSRAQPFPLKASFTCQPSSHVIPARYREKVSKGKERTRNGGK
ncbi:hypothetical protein TNCV_1692401 [Trichonephila clavipes]|nr:hypothetical protein TNCV_1692401 [Trichonephila clavipes]